MFLRLNSCPGKARGCWKVFVGVMLIWVIRQEKGFFTCSRRQEHMKKTLKIAKEFKCSVCEANKPPQSHPVTKMKKAERFNEQVNVDTFDVAVEPQSKKLKMLNIVCEGTSLQMVIPLWGGATAKNTFKAFRKHWIRWAGSPKRLLSDGGPNLVRIFRKGVTVLGFTPTKQPRRARGRMACANDMGEHGKRFFTKHVKSAFLGPKPSIMSCLTRSMKARTR